MYICVLLGLCWLSIGVGSTPSQSSLQDGSCREGVNTESHGNNKNDLRGELHSRSYPNPYPSSYCYWWFIRGLHKDDVITISFNDFDIESGTNGNCDEDNLIIGGAPQVKMCGHLGQGYIPQPYISSKPNVFIRFMSNSNSKTFRGFSLNYTIGRPIGDDCSGRKDFRCNSGKCIYRSWTCNGLDECGDMSDESPSLCVNGTHTLTVPNICEDDKFFCVSKDNKQTCFHNYRKCDNKVDCLSGEDELHCNKGVKCGGHIDKSMGYITSPNFPNDYPNNITCRWVIHVPQGKVIQLRRVFFHLSRRDSDYLSVYNGAEVSVSPRQYSGKIMLPKLIESTDNRIVIKFHSDGHFSEKGFNISFQQKGVCLAGQRPCRYGEEDCYDYSSRCDSIWDCVHSGADERGCFKCPTDKFSCGASVKRCYSESEHCNGEKLCYDGRDEKNCSEKMCGSHNGTFLCKNNLCIFESWRCDGTRDCPDGSDEEHCKAPSVRVITAAVIGSIVCALLLIVALGCTCKLYAMRVQDPHASSRFDTPMSRLHAEFMRRRPPPTYNEAMTTSRPFDEVSREQARQSRQNRRRRSGQRSSTGRSPSDSTNQSSNDITTTTASTNTSQDTTEMEHISSNSAAPPAGDLFILPMSTSSEDSDEDLSMTQFNFSLTAGSTAQWRRAKRPRGAGRRVVSNDTPGGVEGHDTNTSEGATNISQFTTNTSLGTPFTPSIEPETSTAEDILETASRTNCDNLDNKLISLDATDEISLLEVNPPFDLQSGGSTRVDGDLLCELREQSDSPLLGACASEDQSALHDDNEHTDTITEPNDSLADSISWSTSVDDSHNAPDFGTPTTSSPGRRHRRNLFRSLLSSDSSDSYEADLDNDKAPLL